MPKEYLDKIRAKYPQYADIPDTTLAQQIIAKHPEYQDILGDMTHATPVAQSSPDQAEPSYGQRIENQVNAAGNRLAGVGDVFKRNPIAGVAELGNAGLQAASTLAAPITEAPFVGPVVKGAANLAMGAGRGLFDLAVKGGSQVLENANVPAFLRAMVPYSAYPKPETRQEIQEKVGELGGNATALGLSMKAPQIAGAAVQAVIPESVPIRLYTAALKPRYTKGGGLPGMTKNAQTGIAEGIPVSEKGLVQLRSIEDQVNSAIADNIQQGADAGATVKTQPVVDALQNLKSKFELQATPRKALTQIDDAIEQFQNHPKAVNGEIPIDIAQKIKQGTYKGLAEKYGFEGTAAVEADKTIARNLKDQIAEQYPELTNLNARDGSLIQLEDAMTRRVAQMRKSSIWPGRAAMEGVVASAVTGHPTTGLALGLTDIMANSPGVMSKLAIALDRARKIGSPKTPPFIQQTPGPLDAESIVTNNVKNAGLRLDGIRTYGSKKLVFFSDDNPGSPTYKDTFTRPIEEVMNPDNITTALKQKAAINQATKGQ